MAKPLTLLESVLVQILVQVIPYKAELSREHLVEILMRTGLTKQQANKALGR
jgi:hypothetical protein